MQADHYSINSNLCSQLEYPWTEMENPAEANQFKGFNQAEEVPIRTTRTLSNAGRSAKNLRFIDLFAGIGGFRLALESHGLQCVFSSEWDRFAAQTYETNFGERPAGDIRAIQSGDIPAFDLLCAGFPCQSFSIAGVTKKNALGRKHGFLDTTQGTLFFEVARILRDRRPRAFILENVKNLLHHDKGRTFEVIRRTLTEELGYQLHVNVLSAEPFVPQKRERVFLVGFANLNESEAFKLPEHDLKASSPKLGQVLEKRVDPRYVLSDHLWKYLQDYRDRHRKAGNGFGFGLTPRTGVARTLSARYYKDGSEILVPVRGKNPRRLTPRECARLMGFPDSFTIPVSDTQAYRQFGNSVVVPLVRFIAGAVLEALGDDGRIPVKKRGSKPMLPQKGIIESPVQTTMPGLRLKRNQGKQKVKRSNRKVG